MFVFPPGFVLLGNIASYSSFAMMVEATYSLSVPGLFVPKVIEPIRPPTIAFPFIVASVYELLSSLWCFESPINPPILSIPSISPLKYESLIMSSFESPIIPPTWSIPVIFAYDCILLCSVFMEYPVAPPILFVPWIVPFIFVSLISVFPVFALFWYPIIPPVFVFPFISPSNSILNIVTCPLPVPIIPPVLLFSASIFAFTFVFDTLIRFVVPPASPAPIIPPALLVVAVISLFVTSIFVIVALSVCPITMPTLCSPVIFAFSNFMFLISVPFSANPIRPMCFSFGLFMYRLCIVYPCPFIVPLYCFVVVPRGLKPAPLFQFFVSVQSMSCCRVMLLPFSYSVFCRSSQVHTW